MSSETVKVCKCAPDCAERIACDIAGPGHLQCGWCPEHDAARHRCFCLPAWARADTRPEANR